MAVPGVRVARLIGVTVSLASVGDVGYLAVRRDSDRSRTRADWDGAAGGAGGQIDWRDRVAVALIVAFGVAVIGDVGRAAVRADRNRKRSGADSYRHLDWRRWRCWRCRGRLRGPGADQNQNGIGEDQNANRSYGRDCEQT